MRSSMSGSVLALNTFADGEIANQATKAGGEVVLRYLSGNNDANAIDNPYEFIIDRRRPRQRMAFGFGFGIHRCVGNRLAELQLQILWEELLTCYPVSES